jgi:competence protein ComEC
VFAGWRKDRAAGPEAPAPAVAPFGLAVAAALALGVLVVMRLAELPATGWLVLFCIAGTAAWLCPRPRWLRPAGALAFGFGWAALAGQHALDTRLPPELAGMDLRLTVTLAGLPDVRPGLTRLDARVIAGEGEAAVLAGRRLRLSWYGRAPEFAPGEQWALTVRLRRPRGVLNPGGFDFERRALERRLAATGYVRAPQSAQRLREAGGLDAWRAGMATRIDAAGDSPSLRFVRALALGDTRGLGERDWEVLRATGLSHLLAISGFHVGVVAGFAALLARALYWLWPPLGLRLPRPQGAAVLALCAAVGYAAAAGFALPTLRATLMIAAALLARLLRRAHSTAQSLALALIALLLADPLAVLGAGFWLSFLGVAWLLWCLPRDGDAGYLRALVNAQGVAALGLLPLTVWFFGQASLAGPLVNLAGIPWITLLVVPLALLGLLFELLHAGLGLWPWRLAAGAMDLFWPWLERVADLRGALVWLPEPSLAALLLALAGAFWLLLPRGLPAKPLALLLFLPLLWPARERMEPGEFELTMIDVGQGSALLVRTAGHVLLYDAGPAYAGGLDMGEAAVVPALRATGVARLDAVVVSHGDSDHAGGLGAVRRAYAPARVLAPAGWRDGETSPCLADEGWEWDGVRFEFLHPPPHFPYLGNEASCVLRVAGPHGSALLPGDIGVVIEQRLLRERPDLLPADVLVVPHHGSRGSSSAAFVEAVAPRYALYGIGHRNRFDFPRPEVVARYDAVGAERLDSAADGHVRLRVDAQGVRVVERARTARRRFWHEPAG